jgi:phosphoribosylpyrophosphate synthetase
VDENLLELLALVDACWQASAVRVIAVVARLALGAAVVPAAT